MKIKARLKDEFGWFEATVTEAFDGAFAETETHIIPLENLNWFKLGTESI